MAKVQGLYIISVAAQILEMHPQTLRKYERAGFIVPPRMGMLRLYSEEDIARLRLIKYLTEELGLNLAGVELALSLARRLLALRSRVASQKELEAARGQALAAIDRMLNDLGLEVDDAASTDSQGRAGAVGQQRAQARSAPFRVGQVPVTAPRERVP